MAVTLIDLIPVTPADRVISYLPLSHIAEQIVTVLTPAVSGHVIYYEPNIRRPCRDHQGRPAHRLLRRAPGVGEVLRRRRRGGEPGHRAQEGDRGEGVRRRPAGTWTPAAGGSGRAAGSPSSTGCSTGWSTRKAKKKMGFDQTRYMFSAAAPLSPTITHFFAGLGMQILNLYGQSECTGLCSFNRPARNRIGSVGPALPQRRTEDRRRRRDPHPRPQQLPRLPERPGSHRGDLGRGGLPAHRATSGTSTTTGFLYITDRKKDIIITAGGENVTPSLIESELKKSPLIGEAIIIGDERPYLTALISPDAEAVAELGLDAAAVRAAVQAAVDEVNRGVAPVRQIKRFTILGPAPVDRGRRADPHLEGEAEGGPGPLRRRHRRDVPVGERVGRREAGDVAFPWAGVRLCHRRGSLSRGASQSVSPSRTAASGCCARRQVGRGRHGQRRAEDAALQTDPGSRPERVP